MVTLRQSMELAGRNMLAVLSPSHGLRPYWATPIDEHNRAKSDYYWPSHNIGRWWDAMLRLQAATGFAIPRQVEDAMHGNLRLCFDNPLGVCGHLEEDRGAPRGWIDDHSQREALMALACLVRCRRDTWAAQQGARMAAALDRYIRADGSWDVPLMQRVAREGGVTADNPPAPYGGTDGVALVGTHGRLIEALLEFHRATGDMAPMRLADRLAQLHLDMSTRPDGSVPAAKYIHTHSLLGTYRGLLLFGELTRRPEFVKRVATTYRVSVRTMLKPSGFISHDWGRDGRGETTSPGDAAQLAMRLARHGHRGFLDDTERLVRCRLLASQITEPLGLEPLEGSGDDFGQLDERTVGAFGGMHAHPHGLGKPTTDITAADLHTLCDVYGHVVREDDGVLRVDLQFGSEAGCGSVTVHRDKKGVCAVRPTAQRTVLVRVPSWVDRSSVSVTVDGQAAVPAWKDGCVAFGPVPAGTEARVEYDLPQATTHETVEGVEYTLEWRGDEVIGISPNAPARPFYPSLGARSTVRGMA